MADFENDPLATAFDDVRGEVAPFVHPAEAAQIHQKAGTRKQHRAITLATLAALVVAVPAAAYAAVDGSHSSPPPPVASVSAHYVPTPSASASTSPPPSSAPTTPAEPPPGGIPLAVLKNATLNLPAWNPTWRPSCPAGPQKFTDGSRYVRASDHLWIGQVVYGDVDHNGTMETVVRLLCGDQDSTYQVVAFDRGANGKIRTLGQVSRSSDVQIGSNAAVTDICDLRTGPNGTVQLQVIDFPVALGCSQPGDLHSRWITVQWRTFRWTGTGFALSGSPTSFPPNPYASDLTISTTDLIMKPAAKGHYLGTMTVTVKNLGTESIPYDVVIETPNNGFQLVSPAGCTTLFRSTPDESSTLTSSCPGAALPGGSTRKLTVKFDAPGRIAADFLPGVGVGAATGYGDPVHEDDGADFKLVY